MKDQTMTLTRRTLLAGTVALGAAATAGASPPRKRAYRRIATEEGFLSPGVLAQNNKTHIPGVPFIVDGGPGGGIGRVLTDLDAGRIAAMDADGIDMQLLLLASPGVQIFERATAVALAAESNDYVAAACKRHPTRLAALAAVAPQDPAAAAKELERATRTLGLKGAVINSHTFDHYLDEKQFWPIFEAAEALDLPIYIHPREPATGMREIMSGPVAGGPAWAYGVEVGTHVLKLISAGVFDHFPKLRIVVGHMGEALPFWLPRIDNRYVAMRAGMFGGAKPMQRLPSDYIRENLWVTTSGMNYWPQLRMTLDVLGRDRVMYATDYPFEKQAEAVGFVEAMPLSESDKKALFEDVAARVFKI
ncbi:amidohydrolase family protein [Glacieibacterium megasporae]|uniref:amidohydrolase family protein n=1 Tax=Glacieibacterium megasporae TaxID=2835787 RepID=UPI001C1DE6C5|nr:amidohydrolase family protein [Polymorphobacter megasporae]UAJ12575.1 amidohydrolase family protein [Polymorphobacter megasporae]